MSEMIVVTTPNIPGYEIKEIKGIVMGLVARTRGLGGKIVAGFQSIVGGEVSAYTTEMEKARREAIDKMIEEARRLSANAVIGIDVETTEIFEGVVLVSVTGTAVVAEKIK